MNRQRHESSWRWDGTQLLDLRPPADAGGNGRLAPSPYQRLLTHMRYLELNAAAERLKEELDEGSRKKLSASLILERLLAHEVAATQARRLRTRIRTSQLPVGKSLDNFDFDFQPSIDRQLVSELSTLRFIEEHRNVILVGPPGVGKTHLAVGLGLRALQAGYRVQFVTAADMVAHLQSANDGGPTALSRVRRNFYVGPPLLIVDELGYMPLDRSAATWMYHVVSRRYEKGSIVLTSNRGFADWDQVFHEAVAATAIVDRLIHNAVVLNVRGRSYRMKGLQATATGENGA